MGYFKLSLPTVSQKRIKFWERKNLLEITLKSILIFNQICLKSIITR